jgi:hypothetical protein
MLQCEIIRTFHHLIYKLCIILVLLMNFVLNGPNGTGSIHSHRLFRRNLYIEIISP